MEKDSTSYTGMKAIERYAPAAVFCAALIVRLIVLFQFRESSPIYDSPVVDAMRYDVLAKSLARLGQWQENTAFFQPPAYPYFLAAIYKVFGESYTTVRIVQSVIGSASCAFVCLIGNKVAMGKTGLLAGLICSVYGPLIYFDLDLLPPVLIIFWSLVSILLLLKAFETKSRFFYFCSGLSLGVSIITWPIVGLFAVSTVVVMFVSSLNKIRQILPVVILFMAGVILPVLPVTATNISKGEMVLISTNGGINYFLGNNENWQDTVAVRPGYHWEKIVTEPERRFGSEKSREVGDSRLFFKMSADYISTKPGAYLRGQLLKLYHLIYGHELMRNTDLYFFKQYSTLLDGLIFKNRVMKFPYGLLLPLALIGIFCTFAERKPGQGLLLVFLASLSMGLILFFVTSRYRVVLVPVLAVFAAIGITGLWQIFIDRKIVRGLILVSVFVLMLFAANVNLLGQDNVFERPEYQGQAYFTVGRVLLEKNKPREALPWLEKAVRVDPAYPDAWVDIGRVKNSTGDIAGAIGAMTQAQKVAPDYPLPYYNLARIYDGPFFPPQTAIQYYKQFLEADRRYLLSTGPGQDRTKYSLNRLKEVEERVSQP